eukprot:COSAG04_NODE_9242_length_883_cov_1.873724_2_plen_173_part_00
MPCCSAPRTARAIASASVAPPSVAPCATPTHGHVFCEAANRDVILSCFQTTLSFSLLFETKRPPLRVFRSFVAERERGVCVAQRTASGFDGYCGWRTEVYGGGVEVLEQRKRCLQPPRHQPQAQHQRGAQGLRAQRSRAESSERKRPRRSVERKVGSERKGTGRQNAKLAVA